MASAIIRHFQQHMYIYAYMYIYYRYSFALLIQLIYYIRFGFQYYTSMVSNSCPIVNGLEFLCLTSLTQPSNPSLQKHLRSVLVQLVKINSSLTIVGIT